MIKVTRLSPTGWKLEGDGFNTVEIIAPCIEELEKFFSSYSGISVDFGSSLQDLKIGGHYEFIA